jgi:putative transposase
MYAFVYAHRHQRGVEPICRVLEIAPSGYYAAKLEERDPSRLSPRRPQDAVLREKTRTIHAAHVVIWRSGDVAPAAARRACGGRCAPWPA